MNLRDWYEKRGLRFVFERARRLRERYDISSHKSEVRVDSCVSALKTLGCLPTFYVPGMVVKRNQAYIRHLQDLGAEIAVHGYNHVDLRAYTTQEASQQLVRAAEVFHASQLAVHGFRCPYLGVTDEMIQVLPQGVFKYSSNKAIQWSFEQSTDTTDRLLFDTIQGFYVPATAETTLSIPYQENGIVEIPVSVPDDLQLHDGLGYGLEEILRTWSDILHQTYRRGELFNLMFHPELADFCESPFITIIDEARSLKQKAWIARLQDIADWWIEKSQFGVETALAADHVEISFHCTPRTTILCRGFDPQTQSADWDGTYRRLEAPFLRLENHTFPYVGLSANAPRQIVSWLKEMGYIIDNSVTAQYCNLYLDDHCLKEHANPVDLIAYIESQPVPLVRFWPWPDGMRSAMSITGDLDALSIIDYTARLFAK